MNDKNIDSGRSFDFGKTAQAYSLYRDIYPDELYNKLRERGVAADGTSWLDLGTGTGVLPSNLYNPKARITGVDISQEQISFARSAALKNNMNINYTVSPAEETGLPDDAFDVITAAQCFWYFDREKMRLEIGRMIKPGGMFIKIFMNWDFDDPIASKSIMLVKKHNPLWSSGRNADADMYDDIFPHRHTEVFRAEIPFTRESWHGRMCACRGTLASMDEAAFNAWEAEHISFVNTCPDEFKVSHDVYISYFIIE